MRSTFSYMMLLVTMVTCSSLFATATFAGEEEVNKTPQETQLPCISALENSFRLRMNQKHASFESQPAFDGVYDLTENGVVLRGPVESTGSQVLAVGEITVPLNTPVIITFDGKHRIKLIAPMIKDPRSRVELIPWKIQPLLAQLEKDGFSLEHTHIVGSLGQQMKLVSAEDLSQQIALMGRKALNWGIVLQGIANRYDLSNEARLLAIAQAALYDVRTYGAQALALRRELKVTSPSEELFSAFARFENETLKFTSPASQEPSGDAEPEK